MKAFELSLLFALSTMAAALPAGAQSPPPRYRTPAATAAPTAGADRDDSHFYIKGPNAPFKNQIRKTTEPLNANGAK